eukprot:1153509-Pelagomonas_calceolata.AAC.13
MDFTSGPAVSYLRATLTLMQVWPADTSACAAATASARSPRGDSRPLMRTMPDADGGAFHAVTIAAAAAQLKEVGQGCAVRRRQGRQERGLQPKPEMTPGALIEQGDSRLTLGQWSREMGVGFDVPFLIEMLVPEQDCHAS